MSTDSPEARAYTLLQRTMVFIAGLILAAVMLVFLFGGNASRARCNELQDVRAYILGATDRALESVPTVAYYQEHPDELKQALGSLREQRAEFEDPLHCSIF